MQISFTTQSFSLNLWDKRTGLPVRYSFLFRRDIHGEEEGEGGEGDSVLFPTMKKMRKKKNERKKKRRRRRCVEHV